MDERSSASASAVGLPSRQRAAAFTRSQPARSIALSSSREPTEGCGTRRLRLRNPTAFPTEPFSLPE